MIISHRHRLIFLHCRKAAGSSVSVSLARLLAPGDLQIGCVQDAARFGIQPPLLCSLRSLWPPQPKAWRELLRRRHGSAWLDAQIKAHFASRLGPKPQHAAAMRVAQAFPQAWGRYRRFCIVRNPWAKTLSDYRWRIRAVQDPPDFSTYLRALRAGDSLGGLVPHNHDNWSIYSIDGRPAVDHMLRFEQLHADLSRLMQQLQIPWDGWLPHAKASSRPAPLGGAAAAGSPASGDRFTDSHTYRDAYTTADAQLVGQLYAEEIEAHGYGF